jgi:hypothetical protein
MIVTYDEPYSMKASDCPVEENYKSLILSVLP